jgi:hypothetical protein
MATSEASARVPFGPKKVGNLEISSYMKSALNRLPVHKLSNELVCAQKKLAVFSHIHSDVPIHQHPLPFSFYGTHAHHRAINC